MNTIKLGNIEIKKNINIGQLTTMKLGGNAKYFAVAKTKEDVVKLIDFAKKQKIKFYILGEGSNTLVRDNGFDGLVIKINILGEEKVFEDNEKVIFKIGAGEHWDKFVRHAVDEGYCGCEAMVRIPGSVGALAVQNVGAYGQEAKDILEEVEVYDTDKCIFTTLKNEDCEMTYRGSIFRDKFSGKYIITSVKLKLKKQYQAPNNFYVSIEKYLDDNGISKETINAKQIMNIVDDIRKGKLPDPEDIASSGSFFKNAIIDECNARKIKKEYPDAPIFECSDQHNKKKIATGWLIDKAGLKNKLIYGMRPYEKNALVLTNDSAKNFNDLVMAREFIAKEVKNKFGVAIEQEPLEVE